MLLLLAAACGVDLPSEPTAICDARVDRYEISVEYQNRIDLLFVLDTSPSMREVRAQFEQEQLPRLARLLFSEEAEARSVRGNNLSLHVGVISADLGAGMDGRVTGCSASGDQAELHACDSSPVDFQWHFSGYHDPAPADAALRCALDTGNDGCPIGQPLEAMFKVLETGAGDSGFFRSSAMTTIIFITDRDDCSLRDPEAFAVEGADPERARLECMRGTSGLQRAQTYVERLRNLRMLENGFAINFGIVAGVPADLLDPNDSHFGGELSRAYYDRILSDPRLQVGEDSQAPSCTRATASAFPPRRLIEFARDAGEDAQLRSVCEYDIVELLGDLWVQSFHSVRNNCLDPVYARDANGRLPCRMTWELPPARDPEEPLTPISCADRSEVLSTPGPGFATRSARGRVLCEVRQAPLVPGANGSLAPEGEGFYSDDSELADLNCGGRGHNAWELTARARPPSGVTVRLECVDGTQHVRDVQRAPGPAVGDMCGELWNPRFPHMRQPPQAALCGNTTDDRAPGKLFCDAERQRCVQACSADEHCPAHWICAGDSTAETTRICIRPECE